LNNPGTVTPARRKLRIGVAGMGVGAAEILPAMLASEKVELVAVADTNPRVLEVFAQRYGGKTYPSVEQLCDDPNVEAVWIATPNRFHAAHTILAAQRGKHVVVEKPMAISLLEAETMIEAANRYNIKLVCGHTMSFQPPIQTMQRIIESGEVGRVCAMHVWAYTDWMLRPRSADELDINQGGGVPFRQAPHQVDTLRLLGGGLVRSVRGTTGQWFPGRSIPGYYSAFMEFEDGTPATLMHNGHGYFVGAELVPWGSQNQYYTVDQRIRTRAQLLSGTSDQDRAKDDLRIGGRDERARSAALAGPKPWVPNDLGMLIVSCEHADLRQSAHGVFMHNDQGTVDVALDGNADVNPLTGRSAELDELYEAVVNDRPVRHSGQWGMATLEVCLAIMQSARERREIFLSHQVKAPAH
jgi:phthalate 4,5-cis-dihydrodiol dehydrogenase